MNKFIIFADSGCDVEKSILKKWNVECIPLYFRKNDSEEEISMADMNTAEFYSSMKEGQQYRTSAVNPDTFAKIFEPYFKNGNDILYIGISSGLSGTVGFAITALKMLKETYPECKGEVIDSNSATNGSSLLLQIGCECRDSGKSVEETAEILRIAASNLKNWVSVDTLKYFAQSGKISGSKALFSAILNLKPVMDFENAARITKVIKCRGRNKALYEMAMQYCNNRNLTNENRYCIAHADCYDDALKLQQIIEENSGRKAELISEIGPVIGSHCGPGTIALFFIEVKNQ